MILTAAVLTAALAGTPVVSSPANNAPSEATAAAAQAPSPDTKSQPNDRADNKVKENAKQNKKKPATPAVHEEMVVTATRYELDSFQTPVPVSVVTSQDLARQQPEKMVDVLKELPGVDVSGEGPFRGLPVIRGMDSNRVLILVDGQRLNNARESTEFAGIQPGLVDLSMVDHIEVVRGPASVLYGSDAIGGVINIITKEQAFQQGPLRLDGVAGYEYGDAAHSNREHAELNGSGERMTFHVGASAFEAKDYSTPEGAVPNSGMKQRSFDGNLRFLVSDTGVLRFDVQATQTRDVGFPGYDPVTSGIDISFPRFDRNKYSVDYESGPFAGLNGLSLTAYYQTIVKESIMNLSFGPYFNDNFTRSDINTWGFNAQSSTDLASHHVTFGLDFYQDALHDFTAESSPFGSDNNVAVPDSDQRGYGLYAQDEIAVSPRFQLTLGARGDRYTFVSKSDPRYTGEPFDVDQSAGSGNVSARYQVTNNVVLTALVGRGFRAPNIEERSYLGLATTGDTYIEQNPNLKPEHSLNYELGFKVRYARYSGGFNVYQNNVRDFINIAFLGTDPQTGLELAQFQNTDRATIRGAEFQLESYLSEKWTAFGNVSYSRGTDDKTGDPLPLIAPLKAVLGLRYQELRWWGELATRMVARETRVPEGETSTPGFATVDLRGGYAFADGLFLQAAIDNIGNVTYHEPFNVRLEPGRNLKLSVGYKF
jgi:hemoglobin/transferrin/lactoferrin receptor protein